MVPLFWQFLFFILAPIAGLGANNEKKKKKEGKKKNHGLPRACLRLSQGGLRVVPFPTHISVICHLGNYLVPSPCQDKAPFLQVTHGVGKARDLAGCGLGCRPG